MHAYLVAFFIAVLLNHRIFQKGVFIKGIYFRIHSLNCHSVVRTCHAGWGTIQGHDGQGAANSSSCHF